MKHWLKAIFYGHVHYPVWHKQAQLTIKYCDTGAKDQLRFNYIIYHYPNKLSNNYILICDPIYQQPLYTKYYANEHQYYEVAIAKLMQFQKGSLIEELIKQEG